MKIDRTKLLHFVGENESLVQKMIHSFRVSIGNQINEMKSALIKQDFDKLTNQTHILKTKASYMGLQKLEMLTAALEKQSEAKIHTKETDKLVSDIGDEVLKIIKSEGW